MGMRSQRAKQLDRPQLAASSGIPKGINQMDFAELRHGVQYDSVGGQIINN
jgi:hypothetical protein